MNLVMAHLAEHGINIAAPYHGIRTAHSFFRDLKPGRTLKIGTFFLTGAISISPAENV